MQADIAFLTKQEVDSAAKLLDRLAQLCGELGDNLLTEIVFPRHPVQDLSLRITKKGEVVEGNCSNRIPIPKVAYAETVRRYRVTAGMLSALVERVQKSLSPPVYDERGSNA